jgi:hypothetical protein
MTLLRVPPPTPDEVRAIAALAEPVVRNLRITQAYHELACALAELTGPGANWCTVATWASKQAGQSIRKEDLRRGLEELLRGWAPAAAAEATQELAAAGAPVGGGGTRSLGGALTALWDAINPAAAFQRTSEAVAQGNVKVFAEIGYEFARFLALYEAGVPDDRALAAFCGELRPGDPPDGQDWLKRSFTHYHRALAEPDAKIRAELLLLANLEIGFHEQTRLQPEIVGALNAPVYDPAALRKRLLDELFPNPAARLRLFVLRLAGRAGPLLQARDRMAEELQRLGHLVITEHLMTLRLAHGRLLRLGQDLQAQFPLPLQQIALAELAALLQQVDLTPDSTAGTGALDWGRLPDRMHFIADLFRAYHLDATLFEPPFTSEQVRAIKAGHVPGGSL